MVSMNRIRLCILHNPIGRNLHLHLASFPHERLDYDENLVDSRADFIIKIVLKISPRKSNAKRLRALAKRRNIVSRRHIDAVYV